MTRSTPKKPDLRSTAIQSEGRGGIRALTIHVPGQEIQTLTLEHGRKYSLGRNESCDIVLDNSYVSGQHAILTVDDPITIVDLGSRNATLVDGQRLTPKESSPLRVGSVILMGPVALFLSRGQFVSSGVRPVTPSNVGRECPPEQGSEGARLVMRDRGMQQLYDFARQIAPSQAPVLITGETGVGKELMAQAIHRLSPRAKRELVVLNCAAIPESLVESELFGYARGAFSGAVAAKPGLFETAHGSTFFLDEIGELALPVQAKLLRVLETGDVSRLGALRPTRVNVRIVAATNRHLPSEVARGAFRADLYYRLNGLTVAIPPLRARPDDIEALAEHFAGCGTGRSRLQFSDSALQALRAHPWPGNVRELKAVVERLALISPSKRVEAADLMLDAPAQGAAVFSFKPNSAEEPGETTAQFGFAPDELPSVLAKAEIQRREARRIRETLERTAGNQTEAARMLGISRRTLMNRMDRLGISRPRKNARRNDDE